MNYLLLIQHGHAPLPGSPEWVLYDDEPAAAFAGRARQCLEAATSGSRSRSSVVVLSEGRTPANTITSNP
jgi:hypothetical protein